MNLKLYSKIIITIEACVLLTVIMASLIGYFFLQQNTINDVNSRLNLVSDLKTNYINQSLANRIFEIENSVKSIHTQIGLVDLLQGKSKDNGVGILSLLTDGMIRTAGLIDLSIINSNGVIVASINKSEEGKIKSSEPYFIDATKQTVIKSFIYDLSTKQILTVIATPIKDSSGNFIGVLAEKINNEDINKLMIDRSSLGKTGETFLVNSFSFVVTDLLKAPNAALKQTIFLPQINRCLQHNSSYYLLPDYHGDQVIGYARWIPEIEACLVSKIDASEAMSSLYSVSVQYEEFVILILFIVLVLGYFISKSITKPLLLLMKQTKKVKEGDLNILIEPTSTDEVGELAESFKEMLINLKKSYAGLERRIDERTAELNLKISDLAKNNIELEDSRKAITSLLDDIEISKNQTEETVILRTRELSEEKSRLISSINSLSFGFIIASVDGQIILTNPALLKILNVNKVPPTISELAKFFENFGLVDSYNECVRTQETQEIKEVLYFNKYFKLFYAPIVNINKIIDYVIIIEDITERKLLDRSKDEFFAVASHELRTPLTAIHGNTDMILDMYADKIPNTDVKEMLVDIDIASVRLINIVNSFLEVSRLEQGKILIKKEAFELPTIINKVIKNLQEVYEKKNISLAYSPSSAILPNIWADKDHTEQVLINLISNAIKYTNTGGIVITAEASGDFVTIRIIDTGIGIDARNQLLLFKKFQQASEDIFVGDYATSSGLGLYISKMLVSNMGGEIGIEKSELGSGSTFFFTLPIAV